MVDRNLIREFSISDDEFESYFDTALQEGEDDSQEIDAIYREMPSYETGSILTGVVLRQEGTDVLVDVGYKSEGIVPGNEWDADEDFPQPGDSIEVLLEEVEDEMGMVLLSKRKADRIRDWEKVISKHEENDIVTGKVVRKIKGGLLVNIGVNVFLPASQVDIRRPSDIGDYIGRTVQCMILKIDETRRNIVVSRRKLIEDQRQEMKRSLLSRIEVGQIRRGVVKNIADFGAFVDLGGIDGLLHITDITWARINHPSEKLSIDDEIDVMILNVDTEREKIALGLKQKEPSPWDAVEERYPVGDKVSGEVVNVMTYGAFVKLEDGIEGLVHISEMSWTKRINHPNDLVHIGDIVDVMVLGINKEKKEISLGMKQTTPNPWDEVAAKYPPGANIDGTVRNLTNYGAFIEIEEGIDGLLHISDMSWTRKISHASEMLQKGDSIKCQVISVDQERKRIALGLKQLEEDPWEKDIPDRFQPGSIVQGKVTKLTNFGVFVELEDNLEGLLHVSELADHKVENPEDVVKVGEDIEVRILRVDTADRKIGLSRKLSEEEEQAAAADGGTEGGTASGDSAALREPLKGGIGGGQGPLFSMDSPEAETATAEAATEEAATEEPATEEPATEEPAAEAAATEEATTEEPVAETAEAEAADSDAEEAPAEEAEEKPVSE
ncbi:30S ribosomal protein S1 [Symmachiella dynata]|uniref:30S ribosomal protein S1 n=1 Tax=Symmachiella dynata TaxID=2527995 RepID=UPI0030EC6F87